MEHTEEKGRHIAAALFLFLLIAVSFFSKQASASSHLSDVFISNQRISHDTFYFDIYLQRTGSVDYYLGNADFVIDFDYANFSSPTLGLVTGSIELYNNSGAATNSYDSNIWRMIPSSGANANQLLIYIQQPAFSNATEFNTRIAKIDNIAYKHKLGTFYITGMIDASQSAVLDWITSAASGIGTTIFSLDNQTYSGSSVAIDSAISPTPITEPTIQASGLSFSNVTTTSMSLSIMLAGNGSNRVILAKADSAILSSEYPADLVSYTADTVFGEGTAIGNNGVYVIYNGSGTDVNLSGLTAGANYYFAVFEYNGGNGSTENYLTTSPLTGDEATNKAYITVNVKVFLQGPYNSGTGLMNTTLNSSGYLPTLQPFNVSPWNYTGSDSVQSSFFTSNSTIVDWILVELRTGTSSSTIVTRKACFIKSDGSLIDANGNSPIQFTGVQADSYYVVVRHRNHLPIMSANKVAISNSSSQYDFTSATGQYYGSGSSVTLGSKQGMYCGDVNISGIITAADYSKVTTDRNKSGYYDTDLNFSGIVTAADYSKITSNRNKSTSVP